MYSLSMIAGIFFLVAGVAALLMWSKRHARADLFRGIGMLCMSGALILSELGAPRTFTTALLACAIAAVLYGVVLKVRSTAKPRGP